MLTRTLQAFMGEVAATVKAAPVDPNRNGYVPRTLALVGRYGHKGQPTDLVKAAANLYLLWREHQAASS